MRTTDLPLFQKSVIRRLLAGTALGVALTSLFACGGGGSPGSGGTVGSGGTPSGTGGSGSGGAASGSGGAAASGGSGTGTGGASAMGGGSGSGTGGATGGSSSGSGGGGAGTGGSGNGGATGACPVNATFCSGFEEATLPTGAVYKLNGDPATPWTHDFEVDATVKHAGKSSLRVRTNTEASGAYKMLAVPAPGSAFWVRFYIRSDIDLGAGDHNVYAMAAGSSDPNDSNNVEFAEDVGIAFNSHDAVQWPTGYGRLAAGGTKPFTLPKDMWHCIELSFDGQAKVQKLYINGTEQISASDYPKMSMTFAVFKFGYNALHGTVRKTWYDDMIVAAQRINCL
ncbi:MAG: hypothetical protein ABJA82_02245 [Myxococcales bacterium]